MEKLRLVSEELFERVTIESLEHAVDMLKGWSVKKRYRDFVKDDAKNLAELIFSKPQEAKTVGLVAIRFSYVGTESTENIRFYNRFIRGFLRWHRTQAVWVKGGVVKREAYLIVKDFLKEKAIKMLSNSLKYGGNFAIKIVNPFLVIQETKELGRRTKGYLHGSLELGDPDEMFCPLEGYRHVSIREYCIGTEELQKPCPHWNRWRCIYPKKNPSAQTPKVETTCCPDRRDRVPVTNCVKCKESNFAKWQACHDLKKEEANWTIGM